VSKRKPAQQQQQEQGEGRGSSSHAAFSATESSTTSVATTECLYGARAHTHTDTHTHKHTQHTHTHTRARAHAHTHRPPRVLPRPHARGLQRSPMTRVASSPNTGASVTKKAAPPTESPRELPKIEASLERRALLVGTGKLSARNVTAVARALENRAFRTCVQLDLSQARLHEAIRKWRDGLPPTCVACVMFSGLHVTLKPKP
jgi:hypothetical protein